MADLNTCKMSNDGQITISHDAREQLRLKPEARLLEVVVNNCLLLIPQDEVLADILKTSHEAFNKAGITGEELIAGLQERRETLVRERYPGLMDE